MVSPSASDRSLTAAAPIAMRSVPGPEGTPLGSDLSGGIRFDHYDLLVSQTAWSPRGGAAYYWAWPKVVFRAAYDRIFQTPAFENLLDSSSPMRGCSSDFGRTVSAYRHQGLTGCPGSGFRRTGPLRRASALRSAAIARSVA